ncbi:MAG: hypothetical protein WCK01_03360 [Candidatus Uhrbacteria bacterium]
MSLPSPLHRIIPVFCIALFAISLTGCDEKYVSSRKEAEEYAQSHPNIPDSKIFVQKDGEPEKTLGDIRAEEWQAKNEVIPEPTMIEVPPTAKEEGEVLKYEEPATHALIELFSITSIMAVNNNGTSPTITLNKKAHLAELSTYHWNDAKGKEPGLVSLKDGSGKIYGPWQASPSLGQGGVPNAYWNTTPNIDLPAGSYTVIDADPATWSQNSETEGKGMLWAKGYWIE